MFNTFPVSTLAVLATTVSKPAIASPPSSRFKNVAAEHGFNRTPIFIRKSKTRAQHTGFAPSPSVQSLCQPAIFSDIGIGRIEAFHDQSQHLVDLGMGHRQRRCNDHAVAYRT